MRDVEVKTQSRVEFIDITGRIEAVLEESGVKEGICLIFVPHTTAGVTINENADSDVVHDMLKGLEEIVPFSNRYLHREGNSAAHIKASLIGSSESVIIENGRLRLGTWQGIYFCEFDGPRTRKVSVKIIED